MSRHYARTKDNQEMVFGFDRPLQEYFVQVTDDNDELILDKNSSGQSMVAGGTEKPNSNSTMYEAIKNLMRADDFEANKAKLDNILLDLTF
jgi:hypothetical protein